MSELVTDYMEGALPSRMRLSARVHLFRCSACRRYFEQVRKTVGLLARGEARPPAPEIEDAALVKLRGRPPAS
jgi:predicted anti-sigma-YlaC factor YlaD